MRRRARLHPFVPTQAKRGSTCLLCLPLPTPVRQGRVVVVGRFSPSRRGVVGSSASFHRHHHHASSARGPSHHNNPTTTTTTHRPPTPLHPPPPCDSQLLRFISSLQHPAISISNLQHQPPACALYIRSSAEKRTYEVRTRLEMYMPCERHTPFSPPRCFRFTINTPHRSSKQEPVAAMPNLDKICAWLVRLACLIWLG